jgi:hypothetical protein
MTAFCRRFARILQLGRWCLAAVFIFTLSGCAGWNVRDEAFPNNDLSESARKARSDGKDGTGKAVQYSGLTEKGRQIERDLHAM